MNNFVSAQREKIKEYMYISIYMRNASEYHQLNVIYGMHSLPASL